MAGIRKQWGTLGWLLLLMGIIPFMAIRPVWAAPLRSGPYTCMPSASIFDDTWTNINGSSFSWASDGSSAYLVDYGTDPASEAGISQPGTSYGPVTNPSTGIYYLRISSADDVPAAYNTCFTYRFDNTAPVIAVSESHGYTSGSSGNQLPTFTFADSITGQSSLASVTYYWGTSPTGVPGTPLTAPLILSPATPTQETYYLIASGADEAGNPTATTETVFIYTYDTSAPPDVTAPAMETHDPAIPQNTWQKAGSPIPAFTWTEPEAGAHYHVYWGTDPNGTDMVTLHTTAAYSPSTVSEGTNYLRVQTMDSAGNPSANWVTMFTYLYDGTPPAPVPSVREVGYGLQSCVCTDKRAPRFEWDAVSDGLSGVAGYKVYFGPDPLSVTASDTVSTPAFTPNPQFTQGAKFYLRIATMDEAGNLSAWTTEFIYCHGDVVKTIPVEGGSTDMGVPDTSLMALFTFPSNAFQVEGPPGTWTPKSFYSRIWYPSAHRDPDAGMGTPYNHQSFNIALDEVDNCQTISSLTSDMTVTITYPNDFPMLGLDESSLAVNWWNGNKWTGLDDRTLDTIGNKLTGMTANTGEFIVSGTALLDTEKFSITYSGIDFGTIPLTGITHTYTGITDPWMILDATRKEEGWHVTIKATDFTDGSSYTIPAANMSIQIPAENLLTLVGSGTPTSVVLAETPLSNSDQVILYSLPGTSTGKFEVRPIFKLLIPADTYKGTYTNQVTLTLVTGPS
jgi:hypothetical protein